MVSRISTNFSYEQHEQTERFRRACEMSSVLNLDTVHVYSYDNIKAPQAKKRQ